LQTKTQKIFLACEYCIEQMNEALADQTAEQAMVALFRIDGVLEIMRRIELPEVSEQVNALPLSDKFGQYCQEMAKGAT
jgi:hypothetical protein